MPVNRSPQRSMAGSRCPSSSNVNAPTVQREGNERQEEEGLRFPSALSGKATIAKNKVLKLIRTEDDPDPAAVYEGFKAFEVLLAELHTVCNVLPQATQANKDKLLEWKRRNLAEKDAAAQEIREWLRAREVVSQNPENAELLRVENVNPGDSASGVSRKTGRSGRSSVSSRSQSLADATAQVRELELAMEHREEVRRQVERKARLEGEQRRLRQQEEERRAALEEEQRKLQQEVEEAELRLRLEQARARREALADSGSRISRHSRRSATRQEADARSAAPAAVTRREASPRPAAPVTSTREWVSRSPFRGWSEEPTTMLYDRMVRAQERAELPKLELQKFDGDLTEFGGFIRSIQTQIEARTSDPKDRLQYLIQYLKGEPLDMVKGCLLLEPREGYEEAVRTLKDEYGNSFRAALAYQDKLLTWPSLRNDSAEDIKKFYIQLKRCLDAKRGGNLTDLDAPTNLVRLQMKLPPRLQDGWRKHVYHVESNRRMVNFEDFHDFVRKSSKMANHPVFGRAVVASMRDSKPAEKTSGNRAKALATTTSNEESVTKKSDETEQKKTSMKQAEKSTEKKSKDAFHSPCLFCEGHHSTIKCPKAESLPIEKRRSSLEGLCFSCLKPGHLAKWCKERLQCAKCDKKHPSVLHKMSEEQQESSTSSGGATATSCAARDQNKVAMPVVPVRVWAAKEREFVCSYAALDSGSTAVFVSEELVQQLGLAGVHSVVHLTTMEKSGSPHQTRVVDGLKVSNLDGDGVICLPPAYTQRTLPVKRSDVPDVRGLQSWPHLKDIPFQRVNASVGLLIGINVPDALRPLEVAPGKGNEPFAVRTKLGWAVNGPLNEKGRNDNRVVCNRIKVDSATPEDLLKRMYMHDFQDDGSPQAKAPSQEDKLWLNKVSSSVTRTKKNHYQIDLPFRIDNPLLPDNMAQARHRLGCLKRRFERDTTFRSDYVAFLEDMITKGYAEVAPEVDRTQPFFIPHHGVYHPKKPGKIRVVFDCSNKFRGRSLNQELIQGPDLTNNLVGVLIRFRQERVALTGDVEAMFHQVTVPESQRDYLRFLWWPQGEVEQLPRQYRLTVHLFGAVSSPSCANFALRRAAQDDDHCTPEVALAIKHNFYVDDLLKSVATEEKAVEMARGLMSTCQKGGFRLTKFLSSSKQVMQQLPAEELAKSVRSVNFESKEDPLSGLQERALGVTWDVKEDAFTVSTSVMEKPKTKRGVLATLSAVFDPLGLVAPVILQARVIFRELMRQQGLEWDDKIQAEMPNWTAWVKELTKLQEVKVPRCFAMHPSTIEKVEVHHFSDASTLGYAAVSYLRLCHKDGHISVAFVMGKARVTPPKVVTIPRLELVAAKLASQQETIVRKELDWKPSESFFWTDSQTVLKYIRSKTRRFHTFVANRVESILEVSEPAQWRFVPTDLNPADEGSRGVGAQEFINRSKWTTGPDFLYKKEQAWPRQEGSAEPAESDPEVKAEPLVLKVSVQQGPAEDLQFSIIEKMAMRYSSWVRFKRAVAILLRLRARLRFPKECKKQSWTSLVKKELDEAELVIVKSLQGVAFKAELRQLQEKKEVSRASRLTKLSPVLKDGIILMHSRTRVMRPILPESETAHLIIRHMHLKVGHLGKATVLAELQQHFWILKASKIIRSELSACRQCKRLRPRPGEQFMSDLPLDRLQSAPPFSKTGVDYFGPFWVKRGRTSVKAYGVIFTCLVTRAVHLEVAESLSADSFILALRRFVARRGDVRLMRSDNGTNFRGASAELKAEFKKLKDNPAAVHQAMLRQDIEWKFNPPAASHHGGVWERLIRSVRQILEALLGDLRPLTSEGLITLFCEVESIMNSRPITTPSEDPADPEALTPSHMLLQRCGPKPPPGEFSSQCLRRQWRQVQHMSEVFWKRWNKEYLSTLMQRGKWDKRARDLRKGDVVIIVNESESRNHWPLGLVVECLPGQDGRVRVVRVKTQKGEVLRPISKLCLLEANTSD